MPAVLSAPCVAADLSPLRRHDSPARAANILIDMAQNRIIVRIIRSTEGAVMRRHASGIGCGACGRGMNAPPSSRAAPGLRPGTLRSPARSSLTAGREACPRLVVAFGPPQGSHAREPRQDETVGQKARPGAGKTPRWSVKRSTRYYITNDFNDL